MASLCGLNAGHIWSNYLTRKQLSVILKGEGSQLINLLIPLVLLPFPPQALVSGVVKESFVRNEKTLHVLVAQNPVAASFAHFCAGDFKDLTGSSECLLKMLCHLCT